MPESEAPPADGQQGSEGAQAPAQGTPQADPKPEAKFTQSDLDRIVADRVARAKPADYDEAKAALEAQRAREEGEKTELQKAQEANQEATEKLKSADRRLEEVLRASEVRVEALKQGADEELVALALAGDATIKVAKDGTVTGAAEAVAGLLERKPNLKTGGVRRSGGEFGGKDGTTVAEQIRDLQAKGDRESMAEARRLQIAQAFQAG